MRTVRGHESLLGLQLRTRTVRGRDACGRGLSADVKFVDPHTSGNDLLCSTLGFTLGLVAAQPTMDYRLS